MPDLGLFVSSGYEHRVYVLEREASYLYVGIETRAKLAGRLRQRFAGRGAHFTKVHKPRSILMVWPATCTNTTHCLPPSQRGASRSWVA